MWMADKWEVSLLARLYSLGVGMQETPPADDVRLQASTAHVHHDSAHLTRLPRLGPSLDQCVAQPQRRLQTKQPRWLKSTCLSGGDAPRNQHDAV